MREGEAKQPRTANFHQVASAKTIRARELRKNASYPEKLLWSRLRGKQLGGLRFRRQEVIGPFIADFYCAERNLIIEIDGASHDGRADYDTSRTKHLEAAGLHVVRFSNDEVLKDIEAVLLGIAKEVGIKVE